VTHPASGDPPERFGADEGTRFTEPSVPREPGTATPATDLPSSAGPPTASEPAPRTKTGIAFGSLIAGAIVLIVLLVFILENTQSVKISFFGASGDLPLGVALLLAAIGGGLLVGIVGAARIIQLRRHVRRRRR
jgi:lipopolysaccharide assembly protein A